MKHNPSDYPHHQHKLHEYPPNTCRTCGTLIPIKTWFTQGRNRLQSPREYANRKYCTNTCNNRARAKTPPKPPPPPSPDRATRFEYHPTPTSNLRPPNAQEVVALRAAIAQHPDLHNALYADVFGDGWYAFDTKAARKNAAS
jgi:hypothetical protein